MTSAYILSGLGRPQLLTQGGLVALLLIWVIHAYADEGDVAPMSFFEYLAEMVEAEDGWIDPLEMDESLLALDMEQLHESAPNDPMSNVEQTKEKPVEKSQEVADE